MRSFRSTCPDSLVLFPECIRTQAISGQGHSCRYEESIHVVRLSSEEYHSGKRWIVVCDRDGQQRSWSALISGQEQRSIRHTVRYRANVARAAQIFVEIQVDLVHRCYSGLRCCVPWSVPCSQVCVFASGGCLFSQVSCAFSFFPYVLHRFSSSQPFAVGTFKLCNISGNTSLLFFPS